MTPQLKRTLRKVAKLCLDHKSDRLAGRQRLADLIASRSICGTVAVEYGGRDCDGYSYGGTTLIPATVTHFERYRDQHGEWADGPCYCYVGTREDTSSELAWIAKYNAGIRQEYAHRDARWYPNDTNAAARLADTLTATGVDAIVVGLFADPVC